MKRRGCWFLAGFLIVLLSAGCAGGSKGSYILDKAAKAMDETKYYKVKVTVIRDSAQETQSKEISGDDLHWRNVTSGEEQYYIDGVLYARVSHGWSTEKVSWTRTWKEANKLEKAKKVSVAGPKRVNGQECFVVTYILPFASGEKTEELKATDYINTETYRYVKAIGEAKGYKETSIFYDYDHKIEISLPQ